MFSSEQKTVLAIVGPTAVGKTALAIEYAQELQTEIISADSRQCYRELNIGVARPSQAELDAVPHHFIASHSITELVTAATFEDYALGIAAPIFNACNWLVVAGGTGLYLKAFLEGMDEIPIVNEHIRQQIISSYKAEGLHWLQQELAEKDLLFFEQGETKNPQRMMRALEVVESTGRSILSYRTGKRKTRNFNTIKIGLNRNKESLQKNISTRVEQMIANGLVDEVKELLPYRQHNALQTVGYSEIFSYLDGSLSLDAAIDLIKQRTWQYAKRQLTWFKKDKEITWLDADQKELIKTILHQRTT